MPHKNYCQYNIENFNIISILKEKTNAKALVFLAAQAGLEPTQCLLQRQVPYQFGDWAILK